MATAAEQIQELEDRLAALSEMRSRILGQEEVRTGSEFQAPSPGTEAAAGYKAGERKSAAGVARYGVPAATAIAFGGATLPVQMGLGTLMNILSEASARGLEGKPVADEEGLRALTATGVEGAIPFLSKMPIRSAAISGLGSMSAERIRKGKPLDALETTFSGVLPAATTLVGGYLARGAEAGSEALQRGAERAETIERIGSIAPGAEPIRATLGEAIPSLAGTEQRIQARVGGVKLMDFLSKRGERIAQAIESVAGQPVDNKTIASNILEAMNANEREDLLGRIGNLNSAYDALSKTKDPIQKQIRRETIQNTEQALENSIVNKFMGGMPRPTRYAAESRQLSEGMQTAKGAFSRKAEELYSPINQYNDVPGFRIDIAAPSRTGGAPESVQSLVQEALKNAPKDASGNIIPSFAGPLKRLEDILSSQNPTTLAELRTIRELLYEEAESAGQAFGKPAQRNLRNVASKITDTINDQAPGVIGAGPAADLANANKFYAEFRPRFDRYGVSSAFASMERDTGTMAQQMIGKAKVQGLETDAVSNYVSLLDDLNRSGVAGVPSSSQAIDTVRTGLLNTVVSREGRNPTIDFNALSRLVNNLEDQSPGSLKRLGFGDREDLNRLLDLRKGLQGEPGTDQIVSLLKANQPVGTVLAPAIIRGLSSAQDVKPLMDTLVDLSVAGNVSAREAVKNIRANEINDLLITASGSGELRSGVNRLAREERLDALKNLSEEDLRKRYQTTLGPALFSLIEREIVPGLSTIKKGSVAAGRSGVTITGSAQEEALTSAGEMTKEAIKGRPFMGIGGTVRKIVDLGGYTLLSKILSQAAGATGFRRAGQQLEMLSNSIEGLSRPAALQVLEDYAKERKERASQQLQTLQGNARRLMEALSATLPVQ